MNVKEKEFLIQLFVHLCMFLSLVSFMSSDVRAPDISGISMTLIGNLNNRVDTQNNKKSLPFK